MVVQILLRLQSYPGQFVFAQQSTFQRKIVKRHTPKISSPYTLSPLLRKTLCKSLDMKRKQLKDHRR